MKLTTINTGPISLGGPALAEVAARYLPHPPVHSIVAISSKLVSICEGHYVAQDSVDKHDLIRREADYYRAPSSNAFGYSITIKSDILGVAAGVDYANHHFIPWPKDPQATANALRRTLTRAAGGPVGVILTDSRSTPLRRGTLGFGLAHSGFDALTSYRGRHDVFDDLINIKVANRLDGLAAAAVAVMGEGDECTPLVLIEDAPVQLTGADPTPAELAQLRIRLQDDVFAELMQGVRWDKHPSGPSST
jgi:F420-0:gamma-glutamyl ligase